MKRRNINKIFTLTLCIVLVFSTVVSAKNIENKASRAQAYECIDPFPQDGTTRK